MAIWHHIELENVLHQKGWEIIARLEQDDYNHVSGSWIIKRNKEITIDFEGLDDLVTLPIAKSYACQIRGANIGLYFYKKGPLWNKELKEFVENLDRF